MPYIRRSPSGAIVAILQESAPDATEFLPANAPEIAAFLGLSASERFAVLDADFIRVIEDLIDVMLQKGLLRLTDLPAEAQRKLLARKDMRRKLHDPLDLLDDDDDVVI